MIPLWLLLVPALAETPLTLDQAIATAVEKNPDLRSAHLRELVADIGETRARLDRFVATVGVTGNLGIGVTKPWGAPATTSATRNWTATASGSVPLYAGGRVEASIDQAHAEADLAAVNVHLTQRDLVRAAYTAYWNVRGLELQIVAAREGIDASSEALRIIQAKADNGLAAGIDVNRSTVDLLSQQDNVLQEEAALARAREQLAKLLASNDSDLRLTTDPTATAADPAVALAADPLALRPELIRQQLNLASADAARRLARSAALPTISLNARLGLVGAADCPEVLNGQCSVEVFGLPPVAVPADGLVHPELDAAVGLSLTWNPFDLLRTHDAVEQAVLRVDQVTAANESETDQLRAEVRSTAAEVRSLRERFPVVDQQVALARDNQGIVQDLYAQGSSTILDLFNAQSAFRQAAIQQAALQVDLATAELDLRWLQGEDLFPGVTP